MKIQLQPTPVLQGDVAVAEELKTVCLSRF